MSTDVPNNEGNDMSNGNGNGNQLSVQKNPIAMGNRGLQLTTLDDAWRFAQAVQRSGLAPKQFDSPDKILIAVQSGAELGLSPMASLQSICVINGRPSLYGDALPALAWGSGKLLEFREWIDGEGDKMVAHCYTRRSGQPEGEGRETTFSMAQAKRAKLLDKTGPWKEYPERMLAMRARSWNFRDNLSDVLRGIGVEEEVHDVPQYNAPPVVETKVINLDDIPDEPVEGTIEAEVDADKHQADLAAAAEAAEQAQAREHEDALF